MKKLISNLILLLIFSLLISCITNQSDQKSGEKIIVKEEINPFLEKYAGGYMIEVKGYTSNSDAELYVLHKNGNAKWMMIMVRSNGQTEVVSEKMGTWDATSDKITISIKGNTGL